jgi:hypothetical protein
MPSWCRSLVPKYLVKPEVNEESYNRFPSARMLATSHVNLTVLLTFGLVFPPLAVIIALLVLVQTWLHLEMIAESLNAWFRQHCKKLHILLLCFLDLTFILHYSSRFIGSEISDANQQFAAGCFDI